MRRHALPLLAASLALAGVSTAPRLAQADPNIGGGAGGDSVWVAAQEATDSYLDSSKPANVVEQPSSRYVSYRWISVCTPPGTIASGTTSNLDCAAARSCADPLERLWMLWGELPRGRLEPLYSQCFGRPPTAADTPRPQVTPALVLNAIRRIGLPAVAVQTQPAGKTLVNFETIFYAQPQTFTRTLTLLGQRVDVEATPTQYVWHHGDGTSATTAGPGAPYPAKDIVYEYSDAHVTVEASVDVTYSARFRVNGGGWQTIPETVTIAGPATSLRISEATALLSGEYQ